MYVIGLQSLQVSYGVNRICLLNGCFFRRLRTIEFCCRLKQIQRILCESGANQHREQPLCGLYKCEAVLLCQMVVHGSATSKPSCLQHHLRAKALKDAIPNRTCSCKSNEKKSQVPIGCVSFES